MVTRAMDLGTSIPVWGDFLRLTYIRNPNAAFSLALGGRTLHLIATVLATAMIVVILFRSQGEAGLPRAALALIMGGALGNLIDRIRLSEVIDFVDVEFFNINVHVWRVHVDLERWPVFNVADAAVTVGAVLVAAFYLFAWRTPSGHGQTDCAHSG